MKTWITYIAALLFGVATTLLFGDMPTATNVIVSVSDYIVSLGVFITIPLIVFSFTSAIASLRKDKVGGKLNGSVIGWSLVTSLLLPIAAGYLFYAFPTAFPVTSSAGTSPSILEYYAGMTSKNLTTGLMPYNPFFSIATASDMILPILIISWIFGYALKPDSDTIRPAYAVMNSFSEVMFRISRFYTVYGFIFVYFTSSAFFMRLYQEKTMLVSPMFFLQVIGIAVILMVVLIPFLFAIFTRFKKNPYGAMNRETASLLAGLTSGNLLFSLPIHLTLSRHNLGVQKRVSASVSPWMVIIGRGGTAAISSVATLSIIYALTGALDPVVVIMVALAAFLVSFTAFTSLGFEVMLAVHFILRVLNINLYGAEVAVIALIPLLNGIGTMIDAALMTLGTKIAGTAIDTDISTPYQDQI